MRGRQKALFWFLFLFFLVLYRLNLSWKFELTTFLPFSLSKVSNLSCHCFLSTEGKRQLDLYFSLSAQFEQLNTAQKLSIFKFLFLFHFVVMFYSLSSRPLPARPLFLIVLHNDVKIIHVIKAWFMTCIGTENT